MKLTPSFRAIALATGGAAILLATAACQKEDAGEAEPETDPFGLPEVDIQRAPEPAPPTNLPPPVPRGNGEPDNLYTESYIVPPSFLSSGPAIENNAPANPDPFAPSDPFSRSPNRMTAKEILEAYGVTFGPGASTMYGPASSTLAIRNTKENLQLVDAIIESMKKSAEKQVNVRVEIYQVPALVALKLEQSAAAEADHTAELEGVIRLVGQKKATFVTSATVIARSGQRAQTEDIFETIYTDYGPNDRENPDSPMYPFFETRNVGTTLEVDPVLGPDDFTIDLNLSLEHHSAPPTYRTLSARFPGSDRVYQVPTPEFHVKKITTQLTLTDGQAKLLGAWRPTGKPEFETGNVMQVAFLKTDIQTMDFYRVP